MVKREAKDICEKYLSVPATTNFGIMFVPFEGLYAEVVTRPGLIETLGRDYHVNVAGPSTMAAILNSLQMSYQTFRLQKRTDDVLRVLSAVKAELPRYQAALRRAQQQIETAGKTVEGIITTRTNVMERKLKDIDALEDAEEADEVLGLTSAGLLAGQEDEANCAWRRGVCAGAGRGAFASHLPKAHFNVQQWPFALSDAKGRPCLREAPARSNAPPFAARCSVFGTSRAHSR